jgi:hypothetical protein
MKWIALAPSAAIAGMLLVTSAYAMEPEPEFYRYELPDNMMGAWSMADEEGNMERVPEGQGDFHMEKYWFNGVDTECAIRNVEKLGEAYTVHAHCRIVDEDYNPEHQWYEVLQFELHGNILHVENVGG